MPSQRAYTPRERKEALDDFELFLFHMGNVLEKFTEQAEQAGFALDYSLDSLDRLAAYLLVKEAQPLSDLHGQASQYLGEVLRNNFGGKWILSLDMKENSLYYGKPVIVGHSKYDVQFAPYSVISIFLIRRKNGILKINILEDINPTTANFDGLPTEKPTNE